jgi:hypothetical protein
MITTSSLPFLPLGSPSALPLVHFRFRSLDDLARQFYKLLPRRRRRLLRRLRIALHLALISWGAAEEVGAEEVGAEEGLASVMVASPPLSQRIWGHP